MNGILKQILEELKGIRARMDKEAIVPEYHWAETKTDMETLPPLKTLLVLPEKIQIGDTVIETEKLKPLLIALGTQPIKKLDIEFQTKREYDNLDRRVI